LMLSKETGVKRLKRLLLGIDAMNKPSDIRRTTYMVHVAQGGIRLIFKMQPSAKGASRWYRIRKVHPCGICCAMCIHMVQGPQGASICVVKCIHMRKMHPQGTGSARCIYVVWNAVAAKPDLFRWCVTHSTADWGQKRVPFRIAFTKFHLG
jgi:hypothetical protein